MIATFLNKYEVESLIYFDLSFTENDTQLLRLGGVTFEDGFTEQDIIDRAIEIFNLNFVNKTLDEIKFL